MKAMTKVALVSASLLSMGALTACQTTTATAPQDAKQFKKHHEQRMSPEMREKHQAHKAERKAFFEQSQKACDGKAVGQTAQVKVGDKTVDGAYVIQFKADRKDKAERKDAKQARGEFRGMRGEHRPMHGDSMHSDYKGHAYKGDFKRGEPLTDAKRAELTQKYDQRLAKRQAQQQAFAQACTGQTDGKAVQIKLGEKTMNGKCHVRFQPKMPQIAPATKTA